MPPTPPRLPKGFNLTWANEKLAEHLNEKPGNMQYMDREGPKFHWEIGWYIYVMLNNTMYDEYVILPDGSIIHGGAPD